MTGETRTILRASKFVLLLGYCVQLGQSLSAQNASNDSPLWLRWSVPLGMVVFGLWNWLLLKDWKNDTNPAGFKVWTAAIHTKALLVAVTFTPLLESLIARRSLDLFRAAVLVVLALVSSFSRLRVKYIGKIGCALYSRYLREKQPSETYSRL